MSSPEPLAELHELCDRLLDGAFTAADRDRLEQLVLGDARCRQRYVELMHEHAAIREHVGGLREKAPAETPPPPASALRPDAPGSEVATGWATQVLRWLPIAAAFAIGIGVLWSLVARGNRSLATLVEASDATWRSSMLPTAPGSSLEAGRLRLEAGVARVVFRSGAEVRLEGPAEFELTGRNAGFLHAGVLTAHVPERARGFSVGMVNAHLVDLGTDFGLSAPPGGPAIARVMHGEIELRHERTGQSLRLGAREAVRITAERLTRVLPAESEPALHLPSQQGENAARNENVLTLSSAAGRGDAGYVASPGSSRNPSETLLLVKNHGVDMAHQRKACVRFDLAPLGGRSAQAATLTLNFESTGLGYASLTDACTFAVYGLVDDAQDNWSSQALTWETFPAFSPVADAVDGARATKLGTFVLPRGVVSGAFGVSGDALTRFLNADANRVVTLIIVRETVLGSNTAVHGFAGNRHPTLAPPTLRVSLAP